VSQTRDRPGRMHGLALPTAGDAQAEAGRRETLRTASPRRPRRARARRPASRRSEDHDHSAHRPVRELRTRTNCVRRPRTARSRLCTPRLVVGPPPVRRGESVAGPATSSRRWRQGLAGVRGST
jgi:hypothetical protein